MRIAILGGTFNPLHIGHCMLAETVVKELHYDKVLFVPSFIPPHKQMNGNVLPCQRFEMVDAFCKSVSGGGDTVFSADDSELRREGVSYTYDTVLSVIEKYGSMLTGKPALVMGQESAEQFYKWHRADEIARLTDLVIARRHPDNNGVDVSRFENRPVGSYTVDFSEGSLRQFSYPHIMLDNPLLPVSSTEIRGRIATGKAFRYLVPEAVFQYIKEHKLYGMKDEQ